MDDAQFPAANRGLLLMDSRQPNTGSTDRFGSASTLFDGAGDYLNVAQYEKLDSGAFEISFWFRGRKVLTPRGIRT